MAEVVTDFAALDASTETASTETVEAPAVETTEVTQPETDTTGQRITQPTEVQADGRRGPANIRNSIKAASEALPEQAQAFKELGNSYFREQAYKQHFATPAEAATAKQLITDIGGVDGIAGMQQRIQGYDAQDAALKDGNPEALDPFFKDFPEGAMALAPHYLDRLEKIDPEGFAKNIIGPYAIGVLEKANVGGHLDAILRETDPARARALVQEMKQWFDGQRGSVQQSKQIRQSTANDPAQKRLKEQQDSLNKERDQIFTQTVSERVNSAASLDVAKAAEAYVKQYKLGDEQKKFFVQQLGQKIVDELNADKDYKKQIDIRKAAKDRNPQSIADFMSSQVRERLPKAALALARQMYGGGTRPVAATTNPTKGAAPTAPGGGRIFLSARPSNDQLDTSYPGAELDMIRGVGKRKSDGALVQWRR